MLREKTAILAHLKNLRKTDPARIWKIGAIGLGSLVGMAAAIAVVPGQTDTQPRREVVVRQLAQPTVEVSTTVQLPFIREDRVLNGESLAGTLKRLGVTDAAVLSKSNTAQVLKALGGTFRPNTIATVASTADGRLQSASFLRPGSEESVILEIQDGQPVVQHTHLDLERRIHMQAGVIQSSLFAAMDAAGLPDSTAEELSQMFGNEIDFHSDLRKGDRFSVIYEVFYHHGRAIRTGRILAAEFTNQGRQYSAFLFRHPDGKDEYYSKDGKSLKEGFLRSPLEFSRVTSGFSMRLHPILGTWREHKGVDYGAPIGTSVRATADGTVEFAGWQNGYGNFIVVRHYDKYTTAYGHLSAFAKGLHKGDRVKQGDTIGYVGSTGWATGPHLHYEFRINDVHQDPLTVSLPNATPLSHQNLSSFRQETAALAAQLGLAQRTTTARLD